MSVAGDLRKMQTELAEPVVYRLPVGEERIAMNDFIGKLSKTDKIFIYFFYFDYPQDLVVILNV